MIVGVLGLIKVVFVLKYGVVLCNLYFIWLFDEIVGIIINFFVFEVIILWFINGC